ncbi:MAG: hypothetical protein LBD23_02105 [Oscillospiraceae bacterium]|nr:hypothetical protein [Oscillospiraceae bacterium]
MAIAEERMKIKPKIEDILPIYLDGDVLTKAMDFIYFLRENKDAATHPITNHALLCCKSRGIWYLPPQRKKMDSAIFL